MKTEEKIGPSTPSSHNQPQIVVQIPDLCVDNTPEGMALASLEDVEGKILFSCDQNKAFQQYGGSIEYAKELASMKDLGGRPFFSGYDIVAFKSVEGTADYAKKFVAEKNAEGYPFSGSQLAQLYALGLNLEEVVKFTDTAKPNALFEYPVYDGDLFEKNYGAFRVADAISFFRALREKYDVKVVIAYQESMLYDALDAHNYALAMFAGHGAEKNLTLNKNPLRTKDKDEMYALGISDSELGKHLQHLTPDAVIFLDSCSTGAGGEKGDNLANAVAKWADGRMVIAPTKVLRTGDIQVNNLYPFNVTLFYSEEEELWKKIEERKREDITYIAKSKF